MKTKTILLMIIMVFMLLNVNAITFNEFRELTGKLITPDFRIDSKQSTESSDSYRIVYQSALDPMISVTISYYPERNSFLDDDLAVQKQDFKWNGMNCLFSSESEVMSCISLLLNNKGMLRYMITDFEGSFTKDDLLSRIQNINIDVLK